MLGYMLCMFVCVCATAFAPNSMAAIIAIIKPSTFLGQFPNALAVRTKRSLEHRKIAEIDDKIISVICWRHQTNFTLLCSLAFDRVLVCALNQITSTRGYGQRKYAAHKLFLPRKCGILVGSADAADVLMALELIKC